jgi:hypothetical protein
VILRHELSFYLAIYHQRKATGWKAGSRPARWYGRRRSALLLAHGKLRFGGRSLQRMRLKIVPSSQVGREPLGRLGWFLIRIFPPHRVLVLGNPFERVMFGNEALDYFGFAIGP